MKGKIMVDFYKGHGTENDFIILNDPEGLIDLSPEFIRELCNRRAGIGADGILRVLTTDAARRLGVLDEVAEENREDVEDALNQSDWFMDYRNADGSTAEMCGNGVRVFAHFLVRNEPVSYEDAPRELHIATRAGLRSARIFQADATHADIEAFMGVAKMIGVTSITMGGEEYPAMGIDMGNPHAVCLVPDLTKEGLDALPVDQPVQFDTELFPDGVNTEVVTELVDGQVYMRVHERGAGETRSCGTGTVAAATVALLNAVLEETIIERDGGEPILADKTHITVHVPGGTLQVRIDEDNGFSYLRGPSRLIAQGTWL